MKPILRLLWLIGYMLVFTLEMIGLMLCLFIIYPLLAFYYFIKTGDQDLADLYDNPFQPIMWLDDKYKGLLDKIK